jgi:hypothetical protein
MISAIAKFLVQPKEKTDIARAFARAFETQDGKTVLEHLHQHTLFRVTDPNLPPDQLRFLEGQRQLVLFICQMIAKGKNE